MNTSKPTSPWKSSDEPDEKNEKRGDHAVVNDLVNKLCVDMMENANRLGALGVEGAYAEALLLMATVKLHTVNVKMLHQASADKEFIETYIRSIRAGENP